MHYQGITWEELVKVIGHAPSFFQRWYMVGALLQVHKSQLDRISRSFVMHRNVKLSCNEVLEAWLYGEMYYPVTDKHDPRSWHTLHGVTVRMGERGLAKRVREGEFYMVMITSNNYHISLHMKIP